MSGYGAALNAAFIAILIAGIVSGVALWELACYLFRHLSFGWV